MLVRVDHKADAVYLNLTHHEIAESEEVADGIVVDYDAEGRIVGLEILDASRRTAEPGVLRQFSFELPSAVSQHPMTAKTDEAQSLKGILRKPGTPVSIEEMNQAIAKGGTGRPAKRPCERPRWRATRWKAAGD